MHSPRCIQACNADNKVLRPYLAGATGSSARGSFRLPCPQNSSHRDTGSSQMYFSRLDRPCSKGLPSRPAGGTDSEWKEWFLLRDHRRATETSSILGLKEKMTSNLFGWGFSLLLSDAHAIQESYAEFPTAHLSLQTQRIIDACFLVIIIIFFAKQLATDKPMRHLNEMYRRALAGQ